MDAGPSGPMLAAMPPDLYASLYNKLLAAHSNMAKISGISYQNSGLSFNSINPTHNNPALMREESGGASLANQLPKNGNKEHSLLIFKKEPLLFVVVGKPITSRESLKEIIASMGGKLVVALHERVAAVISTIDEIKIMSTRMKNVQSADIPVVEEGFLEAVEESGEAIKKIMLMRISSRGSDPQKRLNSGDPTQRRKITVSHPAKFSTAQPTARKITPPPRSSKEYKQQVHFVSINTNQLDKRAAMTWECSHQVETTMKHLN